jgi:hypothetical protein
MILAQLVDAEVIEHQMELLSRIFNHQPVKKTQKFVPPLSRETVGHHSSSSHLQSRKEIGGAMAFVFVGKACQSSTVGHPQPALLSLKGLATGLFVYGKDDRILGWPQREPDDIGALGGKFRVGWDTPRAAAL